MIHRTIGDYHRIDKTQARSLYKTGQIQYLYFCPVRLNPNSPWGLLYQPSNNDLDFDKLVDIYEGYNCISSETGRYTAFYVPWKWWNLRKMADREFAPDGFYHKMLEKWEDEN